MMITVKDGLRILDNSEVIRSMLDFKEPDDFYVCHILRRKKDHPEGKANESARMIRTFQFNSIEEFDENLNDIKEITTQTQARAYFRPQVRSHKKVNQYLIQEGARLLFDYNYHYHSFIRSVVDGMHESRDPRWVFDLDDVVEEYVNELAAKIRKSMKEHNAINRIPYVRVLPTFHGYHIVTPKVDRRIFTDSELRCRKEDANTILYGVLPV